MENQKTIFTFEIDILPEKQYAIKSPLFASSSGCEWYVAVSLIGGHLSMYLYAESLRPGSVIRAIRRFRLWDTSGKHLFKSPEVCELFEDKALGWGYGNMLSLSDKKKLIIKVEVKVVKVGYEGEVTGEETTNVNGFQVLHDQVISVTRALAQFPDILTILGPKKQLVKTTYMNVLLDLLETTRKPHVSDTELSKAHMEWTELSKLGLKLDCLRIALDWKKEAQVNKLKVKLKAEESKSSTARAKVLFLEQMVSGLKVELDKERAKSATSNVVALLKDAFCFSNTKILGFRERRSGYQLLLPS